MTIRKVELRGFALRFIPVLLLLGLAGCYSIEVEGLKSISDGVPKFRDIGQTPFAQDGKGNPDYVLQPQDFIEISSTPSTPGALPPPLTVTIRYLGSPTCSEVKPIIDGVTVADHLVRPRLPLTLLAKSQELEVSASPSPIQIKLCDSSGNLVVPSKVTWSAAQKALQSFNPALVVDSGFRYMPGDTIPITIAAEQQSSAGEQWVPIVVSTNAKVDPDGFALIPAFPNKTAAFFPPGGDDTAGVEASPGDDKLRELAGDMERGLHRVQVWKRNSCVANQITSSDLAACFSLGRKGQASSSDEVKQCVAKGIDPSVFGDTQGIQHVRYVLGPPASTWTFIDPEGTQSVLLLKPWTTVKAGVAEAMRRIGHRPQPLMRVFSSGFVTVIPRPDLCESHPDAGPFYGALGTDTPRDDNESRKLGSTLLMPGDTVYLTYLMPRRE
jgi:hypothetical protein